MNACRLLHIFGIETFQETIDQGNQSLIELSHEWKPAEAKRSLTTLTPPGTGRS